MPSMRALSTNWNSKINCGSLETQLGIMGPIRTQELNVDQLELNVDQKEISVDQKELNEGTKAK